MRYKEISLLAILLAWVFIPVQAQYFGRNKPNYEKFDFDVVETPNFEIHHYLNDEGYVKELAHSSEHWYHIHQETLHDTIKAKNPVIFYNNHPDFQQTNTINGSIGVGTGGVTEAFKNRVVMPLAMSNQQTNHVLGHELVHAFQYNLIIRGDSTNLKSLSNIPLWLVEGLAEYMSIGRVDAHTSMWMRDAVINDDVPSIKDLNSGKYFPYRYGQAFWAFLAGWKGDDIIEPFFVGTAKYGFDKACLIVLKTGVKNVSTLWQQAIKSHYSDMMTATEERFIGKKLISEENSGGMNIAPVLSPNGRKVIFLSEKNLFTTDLFLADARTGEVIRKVSSRASDGHIDDYSYIESAGTWSPRSDKFAFVAVAKGDNIIIIKDVETGKTLEEFAIPGLPAFSNPAWSPDGKSLVVTGLVDGQLDLYQVNLKTKRAKQLTDNKYSEVAANWSADGTKITFASDELSMKRGRTHGKWTFNIAVLDVETGEVENIDIFAGADNFNPIFDNKGDILFLSNRDGYRNMYQYEMTTGKVYQMTDLLTGISGITPFAPAISTTRTEKRDRILFTHFFKGKYSIYEGDPEDFLKKEVSTSEVDFAAATLPRINPKAPNLVDAHLDDFDNQKILAADSIAERGYKPKFKLDYISGSTGIGVGTNSMIGTTTGLAGGVNMLFGDMLGDHQLFGTLAMNGEIFDFGGQFGYLNKKNRIQWGGSLSHIPYLSGSIAYAGREELEFNNGATVLTDHFITLRQRIFEDKASFFAQYPFSTTLRVEAGGSYSRFGYRIEQRDNYYDGLGRLVFEEREKLNAPPGFNLWSVQTALVGDNSFMGLTAPLQGERYRLGVEKYFGEFDFFAVTADYRKYLRTQPVTFAFRGMHYGRYGQGADGLFPLYLGSPWYIRGYDFNRAGAILEQNGKSIDQLFGSKLFVTNFEIRLPFTGPEKLALIKSKFLLTDLNLFVDGGMTFNSFSQFGSGNEPVQLTPTPMFSAGVSMRINLFGALIVEPYYAIPLHKETKGAFGLNIIPGW